MLLITFAPAASQLMAANARNAQPVAELCSVHPSAAGSRQHTSDGLAHFDGQACGYCHFFAHAPGISGSPAPGALEIPPSGSAAIVAALPVRLGASFTKAQPRAPPVLV